ncbi:hypothetical protein [Sporomusa sp.]|jgi:hypothetical protein|uniref:hypothetical protein n=1 Tax=Sporomusa sp. TaxID=2078658 RepID=UPI002BE7A3DE|nr:hypothetical protein [Sporomusa sp.]HWR05753.1 hypothetical protein [Sporomusa sp.]
MEKSVEQQKVESNASVGYGPNNPEPLAFKESEIPKEKAANHAAAEYNTTPDVNPSAKLVNRTEP